MKNKIIHKLLLLLLVLILTTPFVHAKSAIVGDIILLGSVERSGQKLRNDSSVFEGDSIRTGKASGAVIRVANGRVEIGESAEIEIVRQNPLKIVVKAGSVAVNFPKDTPVEIVTPQLETHPDAGAESLSAIFNATPQSEDRVQSRSGQFTIVERQNNGKANHIMPGQILVATMLPAIELTPGAPEPAPVQGPLSGPQIAILQQAQGDVRVARSQTPGNFARVAQNLPLAGGDFVRTLNGRATVQFPSDGSVITLTEGTTVQVQQQMRAGTVTRRVTQYIGSLWFNITRVTGTQTSLATPTAVAAIRGTQGTQDVPNDTQSTHALNEGVEQVTELVTQQSVTIRSSQRVTAVRGVGFTPVVALIAAITQPAVLAGTAPAPNPVAGVNTSIAPGLSTAGANAGAAAASSVTTVAAVSATAAVTGVVAATVPVAARNTPSASESAPTPLNPPGGG